LPDVHPQRRHPEQIPGGQQGVRGEEIGCQGRSRPGAIRTSTSRKSSNCSGLQNCGLTCKFQTLRSCTASLADTRPSRWKSKDCSRQSSRDNRTTEGTGKPAACQSPNGTSVADWGPAFVTTATTASSASSHRTSTGRLLDAVPSVKGMSATQNSPGRTVIVETFVLRGIAG
jgi:hypothetical protein